MAMIRSWTENWVKKEQIGKGGQGLTYLANKVGDPNNTPYAIKFLKEHKNPERRERLFLEVSALKVLGHPNIPRLIDANGEQFSDFENELFLVTEFIPGPTLQDYFDSSGQMQLDDAIKFTMILCSTVEFCHEKGFVHRDIKPDNIIIKDNDINTPFLIDFGLSFNSENSKLVHDTPSWQHIGNRFLSLPELRVSEGNKRDFRSDVTMICGIFFFCLTGIHPTDLIDENIAKPHRREKAKNIFDKIEAPVLAALNNFFDIAFNTGINNRWQSIKMLKSSLKNILDVKMKKEDIHNINEKIERFKKTVEERIDYRQLNDIRIIFSQCDHIIKYAVEQVINKLKPSEFSTIQTGHTFDLPKQIFSNQLGIKSPFSEDLIFHPVITCYSNGSEFIFDAIESGRRDELSRFELNEEIDWPKVQEIVIEYYINGITKK